MKLLVEIHDGEIVSTRPLKMGITEREAERAINCRAKARVRKHPDGINIVEVGVVDLPMPYTDGFTRILITPHSTAMRVQ